MNVDTKLVTKKYNVPQKAMTDESLATFFSIEEDTPLRAEDEERQSFPGADDNSTTSEFCLPPRANGEDQVPVDQPGPAIFDSVTLDNIRYEQVFDATEYGEEQRTGYIAAFNEDTLLWTLKVYSVDTNASAESNVYITTMEIPAGSRKILLENQRGERFIVDPDARTVSSQ